MQAVGRLWCEPALQRGKRSRAEREWSAFRRVHDRQEPFERTVSGEPRLRRTARAPFARETHDQDHEEPVTGRKDQMSLLLLFRELGVAKATLVAARHPTTERRRRVARPSR